MLQLLQLFINKYKILLLVCISLFCSSYCLAYENNGFSCTASQEALSLSDKNNSLVGEREGLFSSIDERLIRSCVISYQNVRRRMLSNSAVLIDVRTPAEFEQYRAPNSLNLSSFAIKSNQFLKNKYLVLVGNKADLMGMAVLCRELKNNGFKKVGFVKEGVGAWKSKLIGTDIKPIDSWEYGKILPREFTSIRSKMKWLVLNVRNKSLNKNSIDLVLSGMDVMSFDSENTDDLIEIKRVMSKFKDINLYGFLVISEDGKGYNGLNKYFDFNKIKNVFYMEGGVNQYSKYMIERQSFLSRLKRGPVAPPSCNNS